MEWCHDPSDGYYSDGFLEIRQTRLCGRSLGCFQTLTNHLAANFDLAIVITVADRSQQARHFRERTPLNFGGEAFSPFAMVGLDLQSGFYNRFVGMQSWNSGKQTCGKCVILLAGRVVELADTQDLGSCGEIRAGSTPVAPTISIAGQLPQPGLDRGHAVGHVHLVRAQFQFRLQRCLIGR